MKIAKTSIYFILLLMSGAFGEPRKELHSKIKVLIMARFMESSESMLNGQSSWEEEFIADKKGNALKSENGSWCVKANKNTDDKVEAICSSVITLRKAGSIANGDFNVSFDAIWKQDGDGEIVQSKQSCKQIRSLDRRVDDFDELTIECSLATELKDLDVDHVCSGRIKVVDSNNIIVETMDFEERVKMCIEYSFVTTILVVGILSGTFGLLIVLALLLRQSLKGNSKWQRDSIMIDRGIRTNSTISAANSTDKQDIFSPKNYSVGSQFGQDQKMLKMLEQLEKAEGNTVTPNQVAIATALTFNSRSPGHLKRPSKSAEGALVGQGQDRRQSGQMKRRSSFGLFAPGVGLGSGLVVDDFDYNDVSAQNDEVARKSYRKSSPPKNESPRRSSIGLFANGIGIGTGIIPTDTIVSIEPELSRRVTTPAGPSNSGNLNTFPHWTNLQPSYEKNSAPKTIGQRHSVASPRSTNGGGEYCDPNPSAWPYNATNLIQPNPPAKSRTQMEFETIVDDEINEFSSY